jgi:hypothetical protein
MIDTHHEHGAAEQKLPSLETANAALDTFEETAAASVLAVLQRVQAVPDRFVFEIIHCHCFLPCQSVALKSKKMQAIKICQYQPP